MPSPNMIANIIKICDEIVDEKLSNENMEDYEKMIDEELWLSYPSGSFKSVFGNILSCPLKYSYLLHLECNYTEDGEIVDLMIGYTPSWKNLNQQFYLNYYN